MKKNSIVLFCFVIASASIIYSCKESEPLGTNDIRANVRFWNMVPNINNNTGLDVAVDGEIKATTVFGQNPSDYNRVPIGNRVISFFITGTSREVLNDDYNVTTLVSGREISYTIIAADSAARVSSLILADTLARTFNTDSTRLATVRFLHLSPNTPSIDVGFVRAPGDTVYGFLATPFVQAEPTPASRSANTAYRYMDLRGSGRDYSFVIRSTDSTRRVTPVGSLQILERGIYTIFARGLRGGTGEQSLRLGIITEQKL
jgi:hypothetical protein